jgi:hypothetical protein
MNNMKKRLSARLALCLLGVLGLVVPLTASPVSAHSTAWHGANYSWASYLGWCDFHGDHGTNLYGYAVSDTYRTGGTACGSGSVWTNVYYPYLQKASGGANVPSTAVAASAWGNTYPTLSEHQICTDPTFGLNCSSWRTL